jgi:predicted nucleic acid-binding protein
MGQKYLIDSNIIIGYLTKQLPQKGLEFVRNAINDSFLISVIVKIEVLGFKNDDNELDKLLIDFISNAIIISIDDEIVNATIDLKKSRRIKLPDAIIATTALVSNYTLLTRNTTDFKNIPGLNLINPWDLKD